jgi:hypothetical protein
MNIFLKRLFGRGEKPTDSDKRLNQPIAAPCCSEQVHIAYRGISDDRLYIAYNRKWREVKYFRPNGLRIFCTVCRHQIHLEK